MRDSSYEGHKVTVNLREIRHYDELFAITCDHSLHLRYGLIICPNLLLTGVSRLFHM